jgi:hypothetical protein
MTDKTKVLDFSEAAERRKHEKREEKVTDIRDQFDRAFKPKSKPTPVKDYFKKKKNKKR